MLRLACLSLLVAGLGLAASFVLDVIKGSDRIDRCSDDSSPAYIPDPDQRARECGSDHR